jgi:TRAP transporter TAXI family solute receptor
MKFQSDVVTPWGIYFSGIACKLRVVFPHYDSHQINLVPGEFPTIDAVASGQADVGIVTPPADAAMGFDGVGPFTEKYRNLRAIGSFPHYDQMCWAVTSESGITSIEDMPKKPMRIVLPTKAYPVRFLVEKILELYGMSLDYLISCGWRIVDDSRCLTMPKNVTEGRADAVVHEGRPIPAWKELAESRRMNFLPIRDDILSKLESEYFFRRSVLPRGILRGIEVDTPCVDFSDWLLFVREDMPFEVAYAITKMFVEDKYELFEGNRPGGLTIPIDTRQVWKNVGIPLHRAAEKYYNEHNLKAQEVSVESLTNSKFQI